MLLGGGRLFRGALDLLAQGGGRAAELPDWNAAGPLVAYPEKLPLIVLADRPVQLETPRQYFAGPITPAAAFFERWHLDRHPDAIDLARWQLSIEGHVARPLTLSLDDLARRFEAVSVTAINQCSGNSRSRFSPRVPRVQWGNGAMGCATWTGVRLRDLLEAAGFRAGALEVQFEGLDRGRGPEARGSYRFLKSLRLDDPVLDRAVAAYEMNGAPPPMPNGFPLRLVVPGDFATYWTKALTWIRVLDRADDNFWMKSAYRVPKGLPDLGGSLGAARAGRSGAGRAGDGCGGKRAARPAGLERRRLSLEWNGIERQQVVIGRPA